jgi:hypothetical protein
MVVEGGGGVCDMVVEGGGVCDMVVERRVLWFALLCLSTMRCDGGARKGKRNIKEAVAVILERNHPRKTYHIARDSASPIL